MPHYAKPILSSLLALAAALTPALYAQPVPANDIGLIREGPDLLLDLRAGASGPADRIEIRLNKALSRDAALAYGPQGWSARGEGPAVLLEGPRLSDFPALFRMRIGEGKGPPTAHVRIFVFDQKIAERDVRLVDAPPAVLSDGLDGLVALPAIAFAGETVLGRVLIPNATPPLGEWTFGGTKAVAEGETIRVSIPADASGETRLEARFEDPWGRTTVRGEAVIQVEAPLQQRLRPRVDAVQPVALAGEALTVCGWFPSRTGRSVLLDGKPVLKIVAGSRRSLVYTVPESTPPGRHFVSGDPDAGFPDGILALRVVRLDTSVDQAMVPPHVRIRVAGTDAPVKVRILNLDPFAASLIGGESQVAQTDGGRENIALIAMQPSQFPSVARHGLDIRFTFADDRSACRAHSPSPSSASGARVAN